MNQKQALKQAIERDEYLCQKCGKYTKACPHHIKPKSRYPKLKCELNNLITLCHKCHTWVHKHPKQAHEEGLLFVRKYT